MNRKRLIIFIIVFIAILSIPTLINVINCAFGCISGPLQANATALCLTMMQTSCQVTGNLSEAWNELYLRTPEGTITSCREFINCSSCEECAHYLENRLKDNCNSMANDKCELGNLPVEWDIKEYYVGVSEYKTCFDLLQCNTCSECLGEEI